MKAWLWAMFHPYRRLADQLKAARFESLTWQRAWLFKERQYEELRAIHYAAPALSWGTPTARCRTIEEFRRTVTPLRTIVEPGTPGRV